MSRSRRSLLPRIEPRNQVSWNQRDILLYGIGIGAKADDFSIINGACICHTARSCERVITSPFTPELGTLLSFLSST